MGMDEKEQKSIYNMGMLHDIGKIGIADKIINKKVSQYAGCNYLRTSGVQM